MKRYHSFIGLTLSALLLASSAGFSQNTQPPVKEKKPLKRYRHFYEQRAYPFDKIPEGARLKAVEHVKTKMQTKKSAASLLVAQPQWRPIGPYTVGGRIKSVVVHPTDPNTVYIGSAAGGAWKTTNGGENWQPIFDGENGIAFGSLAIDPNNPEVLYAATGEASNNIDAYLSSGVYKTLNGGTTWKQVGLTDVGAFSKIFVHPKNSGLVVAGATKGKPGFYKSMNGGTTWEKLFNDPVSDVTLNVNDENEFFIGVKSKGIYHSTDGGVTWTQRTNGLPFTVGYITVQQSKSNPDIIYTLMEAGAQGADGEIFKSSDHGVTWVSVYQGGTSFFNSQGWYDNFIEVHPTNPDVVLAGGIDIFKTKDGGKNWANTTYSYTGGTVHPDQQHAAFSPSNPDIVYAGNDGGMYKSTDGATYWTVVNNNLAVTQFYDMAIDHTEDNVNYGGTQDNGTLGSSVDNWSSIYGGDGFHVTLHPDNPDVIYGEVAGGDVNSIPWRINKATGESKRITNGLPISGANIDDAYWSAPLVINPLDAQVVYHGRHALYVTYDGGNFWEAVSPRFSDVITAISASPVTNGIIYVGTRNGQVFLTTEGGYDKWTNLSKNGLVNRHITDIACSPKDEATAYVAFSGYGTPHLFKTTNYGASWTNISSGLPNVPHNAIALHPSDENLIFVGTDIGVFATFDGGNTWLPYGDGLPRTPIADMEIHATKPVLRVATHGRSMWEVDISSEVITASAITAPTGGEKVIGTSAKSVSWYGFPGAVKVEFSPNNGSYWKEIASGFTGNALTWNVPNTPTTLARMKVTSLDDPSRVGISNTFSIMPRVPGSILQENGVPFIPYGLAFDGKGGLWVSSFQSEFIYRVNSRTLIIEKEIKIPNVDSLATDIAIDTEKGLVYIHKLKSTNLNEPGGQIITIDTNGTFIREFKSPANYPIGLALVDGKLIAGDRDGTRRFYTMNPETGEIDAQASNPSQQYLGPRGLTYDGSRYLYQIVTAFSAAGGLDKAFVVKIDKGNVGKAVDTIELTSTEGSVINARGIEFDPTGDEMWVSDYNGGIFKIATDYAEIAAGVENSENQSRAPLEVFVSPNPFTDVASISFSTAKQANIKLYVTDALGKQVATLFDGTAAPGTMQTVRLESSGLPAGIYTGVFIINGQERFTQKLVIIK